MMPKRLRSTRAKSADPSRTALLDGPSEALLRPPGVPELPAGPETRPGPPSPPRGSWAPRGVSESWIRDQRGWDERSRRATRHLRATTEDERRIAQAEILAELLASLGICPACGRVVVVYQVHTTRVVMDPLPREREAIVGHLGSRFTGFSRRTPMVSLGEWLRPAHDCHASQVMSDPKRGWKPGDGDQAGIYDMGF